jgi:hypothetical protein
MSRVGRSADMSRVPTQFPYLDINDREWRDVVRTLYLETFPDDEIYLAQPSSRGSLGSCNRSLHVEAGKATRCKPS